MSQSPQLILLAQSTQNPAHLIQSSQRQSGEQSQFELGWHIINGQYHPAIAALAIGSSTSGLQQKSQQPLDLLGSSLSCSLSSDFLGCVTITSEVCTANRRQH